MNSVPPRAAIRLKPAPTPRGADGCCCCSILCSSVAPIPPACSPPLLLLAWLYYGSTGLDGRFRHLAHTLLRGPLARGFGTVLRSQPFRSNYSDAWRWLTARGLPVPPRPPCASCCCCPCCCPCCPLWLGLLPQIVNGSSTGSPVQFPTPLPRPGLWCLLLLTRPCSAGFSLSGF